MPKFEVSVTEKTILVFNVDAVNEEAAKDAALAMERSEARPNEVIGGPDGLVSTREVSWVTRKLAPQELVFKMQIENIRRDYDIVTSGKLPSGESIDEGTVATMQQHLAMIHDELVDQSGLYFPHLAQGDNLVTEHLGTNAAGHLGADVIPLKKTPVSIDNPEEVWKRCATAFGWEYDPDYKGWIKKDNRKPGKIHGEWDAYVRDLSAEDACNEEGIDTVEEAAEALA
jgi:hypothetical protein